MSRHQAFVDYFTHEFMEELWYLQKLARGDIPKRKEADPWETFFNVTQALLSLAPIPGLPLGFLLSKELIKKCIEYGGQALKLAQQAGGLGKTFLDKVDQAQSVYGKLGGKLEAKALWQQEGPMDLIAVRVLVELLGRGLAERYEHVLTEYLGDPPVDSQVPLARVAARRIFEYLQREPLLNQALGSDLLAQRGRLLNGVILGKVEKSWRERITDKLEPKVFKHMGEVNLPLKEKFKKQFAFADKLQHKNKFTAEGVLTRSAWYDAKQTYAHSKTKWFKKMNPAEPKYGYAYLTGSQPLPPAPLPKNYSTPPRDQRYYRAVDIKEIQGYLNSPEIKAARLAKKTATLSFHDYLRRNGHPSELQAVCHDDLTAIKDWSFANFNGMDFSGARITGNVSGTSFVNAYWVGVTATHLRCTQEHPVDFSAAALGFADLSGAILPKAQFTQANLSLTNLSNADLTAIQSDGANWYKTDLSGVKREDLWKKQAEQVQAEQARFTERMRQLDSRLDALENQLTPLLRRLKILEDQKPESEQEIQKLADQIAQLQTQLTQVANSDFVESCAAELKALRQRTDELEQDIKGVRGDVGVLHLRVDQFEAHLSAIETRFKGQVRGTLNQVGDVGRKILAEHTTVQLSHRLKALEFYLPPTVIEKLPEKLGLDELMAALNQPPVPETKTTKSTETKEEKYPVKTQEAKAAETALPARFDAIEVIDRFLTAEESLLLLLGEPGAGKSLSVWQATRRLIERFKPDMSGTAISQCWLPILIELNQFKVSELEGLIDRQLHQQYGLDEKAIAKLKQTAPGQTAEPKVVLLLDGYDELSQVEGGNRRDHSELFKRIGGLDWRAGQLKVIVTCRRRFLAGDHEERMIFGVDRYQRYQRYELLPFTQEQIGQYVQARSAGDKGGGLLKPEVYLNALRESDNLYQLVSNPFVLQLFLESLPRLKQDQQDISDLSRFVLYQAFFDQWLEREVRRLPNSRKAELGRDSDVALVRDFQRMAIYLAMSLYAHNRLTVQFVEESDTQSDPVWENVLKILGKEAQREYKLLSTPKKSHFGVSSKPMVKEEYFMRQAQTRANQLADVLPLIRTGEAYQFVHKSFYEYLVTAGVVALIGDDKSLQTSIIECFKQRLIQTEPAVLDFLYDLMSKHRKAGDKECRELLSHALNKIVERSRDEPQLGQASSNAATILNFCDINLTYRSWGGVQLPGADLRYGVLWGSDLIQANLENTDIRHAFLREVKLTGAHLIGVRCGERPRVKLRNEVLCVAFHPHQSWLAVTSWKNIILVNYETGTRIGIFKGHMDRVTSVAFSPNGRLLASGSSDKSCQLWSVESQSSVGEPMTGHRTIVWSVSFSPDGRLLASGSSDKSCRLWSVESQSSIGEPLIGHTDRVTSVSFSPDGCLLASGSLDQSCRLWSVKSGSPVGEPLTGHNDRVMSVSFSPDGCLLASGSWDGSCRLWSVRSRSLMGGPLWHTGEVTSVSFSPDGRLLASGNSDKSCRLWSVESRSPIGEPLTGHKDGVMSVSFSPDGCLLASGSSDKSCRLWFVESGSLVGQPLTGHTSYVNSVSFSPDGRLLVSSSQDETCRLWSMESRNLVGRPLVGHWSVVRSVSFSPDGHLLASGSWDGSCRLWSVESGNPVGEPLRHNADWATSVSFSPNGRLLAWGSSNKDFCIWSVESQSPVGEPLTGHTDWVKSVSFSPDGRLLASGSEDKSCRLWSVESQSPVGEPLTGHKRGVTSVSFSPDSRLLASGSVDCSCRLWSVESGSPVGQPLVRHKGEVTSVLFSPDGRLLASGSMDQSCLLWNVDTQACVATLSWISGIRTVAFQPVKPGIGYWLLAMGDHLGLISFWQVDRVSLEYRLQGVIRNDRLPLDVSGVDFTGCRMSALTSRLFAQHGGKMSGAKIVEVKETEKDEKKSPGIKTSFSDSKSASSSSSSSSTTSSSTSASTQPVTTLQQKLQKLCEEKNYTFLSKRPQANNLLIQFTASNSVLADIEEIKKELISLVKYMQSEITASGITAIQYQVKPTWTEWSLTITAEFPILDKIAHLLQTAGMAYFPSVGAARAGLFYTKPQPTQQKQEIPTVTCALQ